MGGGGGSVAAWGVSVAAVGVSVAAVGVSVAALGVSVAAVGGSVAAEGVSVAAQEVRVAEVVAGAYSQQTLPTPPCSQVSSLTLPVRLRHLRMLVLSLAI